MEFEEFAARAAEIEAASADTEIVDLVTDLLAAAGEDLPVIARFVQGRVFPAWSSTKLDVGPNLCYEAIARAAGQNVSADDVEARVAEVGEIGEVAAGYEFGGQQGLSAFGGGGRDGLTVAEVYDELGRLAASEGEGSEGTKLDVLFGLFNRCDPGEARYLARLVLSEMRIGVGGGSVRDAVAAAFDVPVETVERALQVSNDYGEGARTARDEGEAGLDAMELELGRPVRAMLAQTGTVTEALAEWDEVACEVKYDGARVQVHYDPEGLNAQKSAVGTADDARTVGVYSRNMEDVTDALPEVVEFVEDDCDGPAILDGEVVAVRDGEPLPFQEVLRRFRRKHEVERAREEVAVELHAFDCLHADGTDLLDAALVDRREHLEDVLPEATSEFLVSDDAEEVEEMDADALEAGHEGIMLKNPRSAYTPGRRGKNWLKRKPDVETLDLVVTGAEWGEGRRAQFLGTFLLSARAEGEFETIGKVATGITDEKLADLTGLLEPYVEAERGKEVDLEPAVVFEVGYEEIQESPTYSSGYALRFPRFVAVRDDKEPGDADTLERVERLADGR
ncbi:DNA ligase [Halobacteriales archaeon QS_1_68_20]|nr:MAG: DNA ligase [Halobacteriales archaeon QS_1_68_20]